MEKTAQFLDEFPFFTEVKEQLPSDSAQDFVVYDDEVEKDAAAAEDEVNEFSQDEEQDVVESQTSGETEITEINLPEDGDKLPEVIQEIKEDMDNSDANSDVKKEYVFKLDTVPGAEADVTEIAEDEVPEVKEGESEKVQVKDDWDWRSRGVAKFLDWLQERFTNVPKHSGQDTTGIERCIAYFKRLNSEISKAMSEDYKREIDAAKAEEARSEIIDGLNRLLERLDKLNSKKFKNKKKAEYDSQQFVKTAETSTTGKIVVTVPYLISNIARACIESTVQGGKDIEDCFEKLSKEYSLDKREEAQVVQLIKDMGYPIMLDRMNPFKDINPSSTKEVSEYQANYYA